MVQSQPQTLQQALTLVWREDEKRCLGYRNQEGFLEETGVERGGKGDLTCEACSRKLAALATKLCQTRGS